MAALSTAARDEIEKEIQRQLPRDTSEGFSTLPLADLRAAINAVDQWAEDNASEYNTAIPQPARGVLTAKQKSWLLVYVVLKRAKAL